ncbi:MAG: hypothetical protein ABFS35_02275 [Bacteroidota bacterium]
MLLYIDEHQLLQHDRELSLFNMEWKSASARLRYKNVARRFMSAAVSINRCNPKFILVDFEQLVYKQIWGKENQFYQKIHSVMKNAGVEKFAYIKSKDKLTEVLFDQLIFNSELNKVEVKSFETPEEARTWLLSDQKIKSLQKKFAISA